MKKFISKAYPNMRLKDSNGIYVRFSDGVLISDDNVVEEKLKMFGILGKPYSMPKEEKPKEIKEK